jgi:hypothetical protein
MSDRTAGVDATELDVSGTACRRTPWGAEVGTAKSAEVSVLVVAGIELAAYGFHGEAAFH